MSRHWNWQTVTLSVILGVGFFLAINRLERICG
jgi:hypothetical protein